ncbi:beta-1,3-galactosyltransferase 1-like [Lingula anatina]|uniref:Hexosyltransferase n=1 Tax=Lingula anatina TaxID=7574 RepID=A0A1S3HL07_LINAN|nr:beta-1,3-galactosyltransferase 1-like [Lingula anatina]|eukprot:XP_013386707.1 beta-1,3-galactosyltransferase 1-like [Lingula anatina]
MEPSENLSRRPAVELVKEDTKQISLGDCMVPEIVCKLKKSDSDLWYHIKRYRYIINNPCWDKDTVFLLVLVVSDPRDFMTRDMYRKTCGSVKDVLGEKIKTVFVVGQTNDSGVERGILAENSEHRDIIKMTFIDTYKNFTLKTLLAMRWAIDYCAGAKFVLRCGHDVIANYRQIIRYLKDLPKFKTETLFTGYLHSKGNSPFRNPKHKYYQSFRQYSGSTYPAYLSGFATVASFEFIRVLHSASFWKHLFIEDVYLATLAHENGIELVHNPNFWLTVPPKLKKDSCLLSMLLAIHKAPNFKFWSILYDLEKPRVVNCSQKQEIKMREKMQGHM